MEGGGGEDALSNTVLVAPPENAAASRCVRGVADEAGAAPDAPPLSFSAVLPADCFVKSDALLDTSVSVCLSLLFPLVNHIYAKPKSNIVRTLKRTLQTIRGLHGPNAFNLKQPYV